MITLVITEKEANRIEEALEIVRENTVHSIRMIGRNPRAVRSLDYNIMRTNDLKRKIRQSL